MAYLLQYTTVNATHTPIKTTTIKARTPAAENYGISSFFFYNFIGVISFTNDNIVERIIIVCTTKKTDVYDNVFKRNYLKIDTV